MEIKGTAVKSTINFIKAKFPDRYKEWLNKLPPESKAIVGSIISPGSWYPLAESTLIPTKIAGEIFFNNAIKGAREAGRYSAELALKGVYKVFVRIATPKFIISRTANVYASYYRPAEVTKEQVQENLHYLNIYKYDYEDDLMIHRMAGWIERAFEITKRTGVKAEVSSFEENGEKVYRITASWD